MSDTPRISVIIPTIGRPDDLRKMFATLIVQTVLPHEFVLVNAGPMDLKDLCEECLADFNPACLEHNTTAWTQRMPQINVR